MGTYPPYVLRHLPELIGLAVSIWIQFHAAWWVTRTERARRSIWLRPAAWAAATLLSLWLCFGVVSHFPSGYRALPSSPVIYWARGAALAWAFGAMGAYLMALAWRRAPRFSGERRGFIRAAAIGTVAAPYAVLGFGMFVQRTAFRVREIEVPIPGLPKDLEGLRIVQVSDIHLSPFLSERELARAIDMANGTRAHLAVVTGDLITSQGDPLHACIRQLARLRADAGVLGCLGNHEIYAHAEDETERGGRRAGIDFLRKRNRVLRFGGARLNIAGMDYQRGPKAGFLRGAERLIVPGATNLLLSHNPNSFDRAAEQGWDVTLAGHTHGGQINIEILDEGVNAARFFTPYVYGLYRKGPKSLWVTRGLGTVGLPARVGAPPEVALIRLCAT